jgi:hypothetical protein
VIPPHPRPNTPRFWLVIPRHRGTSKGRIEISKDSRHGCYPFPRTKEAAVARIRQFKRAKMR